MDIFNDNELKLGRALIGLNSGTAPCFSKKEGRLAEIEELERMPIILNDKHLPDSLTKTAEEVER